MSAAFCLTALSASPAFAVCGDPTGDGQVTTADALYTLRAGVSQITCALSICDVDGDGEIDTADALSVLRNATGLPPALACLALPDDALYDEQWGLPAINAPAVWATRTDCSDVTVAVIDTGVDYYHEDLRQNLWRNPDEIPFNHKDDDGNGLVDDVNGYDFVDNDEFPWDPQGHGTHVAGTIGAVGNTIGVVGVCWKASIMILRFLDEENGGTAADALQAVDYARKKGARVMNNSWGGGSPDSGEYYAFKAANDAGMVNVVAGGNDGKDTDIYWDYPGHYRFLNQINVAASTESGGLAGFSNYGKESIDVVAPGDGILSTVPLSEYDTNSGTSMAAPHVAGAAAMLLSEFPNLSALDVKQILIHTSAPGDEDEFEDATVSGGQIDLAAAFIEAEFVQLNGAASVASSEQAASAAPDNVKSRKVLRSYTSPTKKDPKRQDVEEKWSNGETHKSSMVADHVIVVLEDEATVGTLAQQGFKIRRKLVIEQPTVLVEAPDGVDAAVAALTGVEGVVSVSPDYILHAR